MKKIVPGKVRLGLLLIALSFFVFQSCSKNDSLAEPEAYQASTKKSGDNEEQRNGAPEKGDMSIAEIAIENEFTELLEALYYVDEEFDAGLVNLFLYGTDQYTVFAPTNDAFEALYEDLKVDGIRDLPASLVLDVLKYHVTDGRRASNSVVPPQNKKEIETWLGEVFYVHPDMSITAIGNSAKIEAADFSASNGIVHVISAVLLPVK
ncbi:fasciclin domain-containing protein [Salegentibacter chungangensis]|uniref:Fasciclin domain-containing protein n=1 Tax=Salegentibacter chungangensis TaxID=1335724 RepID=A0ABW3NN70_9FLAO